MNFNHRLAQGQGTNHQTISMIQQIQKPLVWLIPLLLVIISWWKVLGFFGKEWEIGAFSTSFVPLVAGSALIKSSIVLLGYVFGSFTFYNFVYNVTKRHLTSLIVGLLTLLPLSLFSAQAPERLMLALTAQDGAHILGFSFVPLTAIFYLYFLRTGSKKHLLLVIIGEIIVSLISFFAQYILIFFYVFITLSEILISEGGIKLRRFGQLLVIHVLISLAVYNVSLWGILVSESGRTTMAVLTNLLPLSFFIVPVLGTFAFLIFDRRPSLQPLFLAGGLTLIFGLLHFVRISFVDSPILQQDRYAAELSFARAFLIGIIVTWVFDLLRGGKFIGKYPLLYNNRTLVAFTVVLIFLTVVGMALFVIPHGLE